jgi:hypothetical protein
MASNQAESVASPKQFDFEPVTEDSDYLGVKRIEFKLREWRLDTKTLVKKETIELLPNAKFQLTIQCKQIGCEGSVCSLILKFFIDNDNLEFTM